MGTPVSMGGVEGGGGGGDLAVAITNHVQNRGAVQFTAVSPQQLRTS